MKNGEIFLRVIVFIIALWDIATTFQGMRIGLQNNYMSLVLMCFINGTLLLTFSPLPTDNSLVMILSKFAWVLALVTDLITAYIGNMTFITFSETSNQMLQVFLIAITASFTSFSTIAASYFLFNVHNRKSSI